MSASVIQPGCKPYGRGGRPEGERRSFTLIELLVVVGIITIIVLILLPAIHRSIRQAARTVCMHNLREINQALQMYRLDNNGYVPVDTDLETGPGTESRAWFVKLCPRYLGDLAVLACPDDPFRYQVRAYAGSGGYKRMSASSYGLNDLILSSPKGYLANLDRCQPKRAHDTLLIADVGPDSSAAGDPRPGGVATLRSDGRLPCDDNYNPGAAGQQSSWLTERHLEGINALAMDGSVRHVRTADVMCRTIQSYYAECAAGDCALCLELRTPHYSFADSRLFWWTGPVPPP